MLHRTLGSPVGIPLGTSVYIPAYLLFVLCVGRGAGYILAVILNVSFKSNFQSSERPNVQGEKTAAEEEASDCSRLKCEYLTF
jgi:hypothetical protein